MGAQERGFGALLDAVRGVRWPARRPVPGVVHGAHHSRLRGISPEFTEYRPYRQGDDPRRIDWKLLGRTDRANIRLSDDRAVLPTMVVVDASASMAFPDASLAKWRQASALAVALAAIAQGQFDPVGLAIAADAPVILPPRARRGAVAAMAEALARATPGGRASLAAALARTGRAPRVVLISDFLGDEDELLRIARELQVAGVELHAIHIVAAEELEPGDAAALVYDPEDEDLVRPLGDETREGYLRAFDDWRTRLAAAWLAAGAFYALVRTDESPANAARRIAAATGGG